MGSRLALVQEVKVDVNIAPGSLTLPDDLESEENGRTWTSDTPGTGDSLRKSWLVTNSRTKE